MIKRFVMMGALLMGAQLVSGCSTNPATGESQFTALMSPAQEVRVGAEEHQNIIKEYGLYQDAAFQDYVNRVGQAVVKNTERPDVQYKFYVLDSPIVNAFALPGGYIYLSRGLVTLANSEAEMASVLAHEAGHITGRHSAERYSRGVVTSLGAAIISAAVGTQGVGEALGLGANLYIKSYSRGQENQADSLGIRYLSRAGYDPDAMSSFLYNLQAESALEAKVAKKKTQSASYFSTHPATSERVSKTISEAKAYPHTDVRNRDTYLQQVDGMIYGDSAKQGLIRGQNFVHPEMGFGFSVPQDFRIVNSPSKVVAGAENGSLIIFDMVANKNGLSPMRFLQDVWMKEQDISGVENIRINGLQAATGAVQGSVNGKDMQVRLVAIEWSDKTVARFQIAIPRDITKAQLEDLQRSTYSFKRLSAAEKNKYKPYRIRVVRSSAGDSVASLAARMAYDDYKEDRFRVLNGLKPNESVRANTLYKIVVE